MVLTAIGRWCWACSNLQVLFGIGFVKEANKKDKIDQSFQCLNTQWELVYVDLHIFESKQYEGAENNLTCL